MMRRKPNSARPNNNPESAGSKGSGYRPFDSISEGEILFCTQKSFSLLSLSLAIALPVSAQTGAASKQEAVHAGQKVFTQRCFQCHSVIPDQVRFGPSLHGVLSKPHPRKTDAQVRMILKNGKGKMPSFNDVLSKQETDDLLAYLHSL